MDDVLKQRVLQRCIALKNHVAIGQKAEYDDDVGICRNVLPYFDSDFNALNTDQARVKLLLEAIFVKWPEHSGNDYYPVPDPDCGGLRGIDANYLLFNGKTVSASWLAAKRAYDRSGDMWHGPYGEARMRLLDFIIQTLSEELHNAV